MKKFFMFFTALITLVLTSSISANAQTITNDSLTYEFANSRTKLSATTRWNAGIYEHNLEDQNIQLGAYIGDFTSKCTLKIIDQFEVEIEVKYPQRFRYAEIYDSSQYLYETVGLFNLEPKQSDYCTYRYEGKYGDENHRNGTNIQPFFLFNYYNSVAQAPDLLRYNSITGNYVAKFFMDLPVSRDFRLGISFSTIYQQYEEISGWDTFASFVSNSNIIYTDYFRIN